MLICFKTHLHVMDCARVGRCRDRAALPLTADAQDLRSMCSLTGLLDSTYIHLF
jgi:hypothetical protein